MDFVPYSSALLALLAFSGAVQAQEDDPLVGDRPDFTEASSTVGMHRLQIEGGYTYSYDRTTDERLDEHGLHLSQVRTRVYPYPLIPKKSCFFRSR